MKDLKHFILVGPPASGKGTQGRFLADTFNLNSLSTGSLLRREVDFLCHSKCTSKNLW